MAADRDRLFAATVTTRYGVVMVLLQVIGGHGAVLDVIDPIREVFFRRFRGVVFRDVVVFVHVKTPYEKRHGN